MSKLCGAKTKGTGELCKLPAGYGTNHKGTGRCKYHGGCSTGPKVANTRNNSIKHGLFAQYLPEEIKNLVDSVEDLNSLDILWTSIKIKFGSIIRAQKIMEVEDKDEIIKELKKYRENPNGSIEEEYELQFAWDRYERYLNAQSKAMDTLTRMIGKYEELCNSGIATEEQLLRIEKLKTEVNILKGVSDEIEDLSDIQKLIYGKEDD